MLTLFETSYSTKQLYDLLEQIDVYDAIKKLAVERVNQEAKQNK